MYDLIIVGAGPAGTGAGVYSARKRMRTLVLAKEMHGQSFVSDKIYNWVGTIEISGRDLAKNCEEHLAYYENIQDPVLSVKKGEEVMSIVQRDGSFVLTTKKGAV